MSINKLTKNYLIVILALYLTVSIYLLPFYQYQINPDGISYINIAQNYLKGHIFEAINAYWGPLYSLLLVPFLAAGISPLLSTKILSILIGMSVLLSINKLFKEVLELKFRFFLLISLIPTILYFAYFYTTADLLLASILLLIMAELFDSKISQDLKKVLLIAGLGFLAYFTKLFGLYFFLVLYFMFSVIEVLKAGPKKKKILFNLFIGLFVFAIFVGIWSSILFYKYKFFTLGTSAGNIRSLIKSNPLGNEFPYLGLTAPSNSTATSAWYDPLFIKIESRGLVNQISTLSIISNNFYKLKDMTANFGPFLLVSLLISSLLALFSLASYIKYKKLPSKIEFYNLYTLCAVMIYTAAYLTIIVKERYFIPVFLLSIVNSFLIIYFLIKNSTLRSLMIIMLIVLINIYPVKKLKNNLYLNQDIYKQAEILKKEYKINKAVIASDANWEGSLALSFELNSQYLGQTIDIFNQNELINKLADYKVDYFFVWYPKSFLPQSKFYKKIYENSSSGLKIYAITN